MSNHPPLSDRDLDRLLRDCGEYIAYPATPDAIGAVLQSLKRQPQTPLPAMRTDPVEEPGPDSSTGNARGWQAMPGTPLVEVPERRRGFRDLAGQALRAAAVILILASVTGLLAFVFRGFDDDDRLPGAAPAATPTYESPALSPTTPTLSTSPQPVERLQALPVDGVLFAGYLGDDPGYTLYTLAPGEDEPQPLLPPADSDPGTRVFDAFPAWSPSGESVAFISTRGGSAGIYVVGPDTSGPQLITEQLRTPYGLSWAPDGEHLVYMDEGVGDRFDLFVIDLNDGAPRNLTQSAAIEGSPAWSPQGDRLAFARREADGVPAEIYAINLDGSGLRNLSRSEGSDAAPAWSLDGSRIAFLNETGVVVVDLDSGESRTIVDDPQVDGSFPGGGLRWSPDGGQLAFTSRRDGSTDVFIVDIESLETHQLTATPDRNEVLAGWSSDGRRLVLMTQPGDVTPDSNESAIWDVRLLDIADGSTGVLIDSLRLEPFLASLPAFKP